MNANEAKGLSVLAQLRQAVRLAPERWPGTELPLQVRVLTSSEVQECHAAAVVRFTELRVPVDNFFASLFEEELGVQILFRACRSAADPSVPFAVNAADIRDNTTPDERNAMIVRYNEHRANVDPDPEQLGEELVGQVVAALKKKDKAGLKGFGSHVLATYMLITDGLPSS